jgi:hypothetical protein
MLEDPQVSNKIPINENESNILNKELKITDFFVN